MSNELKNSLITALLLIIITGLVSLATYGVCKWIDNPEWKENFMNNFGLALANVIDILDPDVVVLGGGLSKVDMLYTEGLKAAYKESFSDIVVTPIIKNKLGDSSGVFGAAMIMDHI